MWEGSFCHFMTTSTCCQDIYMLAIVSVYKMKALVLNEFENVA
jgi:hypothetical protein